MITEIIQTTFDEFYNYFKDGSFLKNDFAVAGVITATTLTLWKSFKRLPTLLWSRIRRLLFYSITIEESSELYVYVSKYLEANHAQKHRKCEAILNSDKDAHDQYDETYPSIGEDKPSNNKNESGITFRGLNDWFYIFTKFRIIKVSKEREKFEQSEVFSQRFMGSINLSGLFCKSIITDIINSSYLTYKPEETEDVKIRKPDQNYWYTFGDDVINKRTENIFFPNKKNILDRIDIFQQSKELYGRACVDWYLGILLHGKAGSGKTQFSRSLATYTKRNLYTIALGQMSDERFRSLYAKIEPNTLLLLDDIDVALNGRDDKIEDGKNGVSLQTLLDCLDGNNSKDDIIVVMTTNNKEKLDEALIRKGRIDLIEEVSYPDLNSVKEFLANFYQIDISDINLSRTDYDQSMVNIQDICLRNAEDINQAILEIEEL